MQKRIAVVFVSRRNSLRSVLAQACLAHLDDRRFAAFSCGQPGQVARDFHPAALGALLSAGIVPPNGVPHDWTPLAGANGPHPEFVISLDESTLSAQPRWHGQPDSALWAYPDVAAELDPEAVGQAAIRMLYSLRRRLELLISLPMDRAVRAAVRSDVRDLAYLG